MLLDPDFHQRMLSFASQAAIQQTPPALASGSHAPMGADCPATAIARRVTSTGDSGSSIFTTTTHLSRQSFLRSIDKTLAKTQVYRNARRNLSTDSFNTTATGNSRWSQLSGLSLGEISNVSIICLPVYIVELNNGQVYQQVLGKTADGKVTRDILTLQRLQRPRQESINVAADLRLRLFLVAERESRLLEATAEGDSATVQLLSDRFASSVHVSDANRQTSLRLAATAGHEATVRLLLDRGAEVDVNNWYQDTPLHLAATRRHEATVRLLLDRGA